MESPPLLIYRLGNWLHLRGFVRLGVMATRVNRLLFGCWIPSSAKIGRGVKLGYWALGIVLHSATEIGPDCWIMQNVTIGRNPGDKGVPRLGRNVMVGTGAVVVGSVVVGDNAMIGANSVVLHDVLSGTLVAGAPARLIRVLEGSGGESHYARR